VFRARKQLGKALRRCRNSFSVFADDAGRFSQVA